MRKIILPSVATGLILFTIFFSFSAIDKKREEKLLSYCLEKSFLGASFDEIKNNFEMFTLKHQEVGGDGESSGVNSYSASLYPISFTRCVIQYEGGVVVNMRPIYD